MLMKSSPVALYTSMYLLPMWCLCRLSAMSLWATLSSSTRASPLRRPCGDRHSATPENICYTKNISEQYKASPPGATLRPVKNLATSVSLACQGSPLARTTQLPSTWEGRSEIIKQSILNFFCLLRERETDEMYGLEIDISWIWILFSHTLMFVSLDNFYLFPFQIHYLWFYLHTCSRYHHCYHFLSIQTKTNSTLSIFVDTNFSCLTFF